MQTLTIGAAVAALTAIGWATGNLQPFLIIAGTIGTAAVGYLAAIIHTARKADRQTARRRADRQFAATHRVPR